MDSTLTQKILQVLEEKYQKSGGHCGTYAVDLVNGLNHSWQEIREAMKPLYTENKIVVKPGQKGNLFFINREKRKRKVERKP